MKFRVVLVQVPCEEGRREENSQRVRELLRTHRYRASEDSGPEFIVLPELFAIGFRHADYERLGQGVPGPTEDFVRELASETGAFVVTTDIEAHGERYYNTLVMASPQGRTIARYRKVHPFQAEKDVFDGGDTLALVDIGDLRVGLQICYDIRFPEMTRRLALEGAELVLIPAAFPNPRSHHWDALLQARAIENLFFVAAANRVGSAFDGKTYFGHSQLVDPWGVRRTEIESSPRVIVGSGDTEAVKSARTQLTCFEDRRPEAYERVQVFRYDTTVK